MTTKKTQIASGLAALAIVATAAWTRADDGHGGLAAAFTTSQAAFTAAREGRERNRRPKTADELLREAKDKDALAKLPPPTEKEWCEAGGHHLFVISPKTGNKYCIPATTDRGSGERGGGERPKTKWEIDREIETLDYWAAHPAPPRTPKQECEGLFADENKYVKSTKGNFYCLKAREEGGRRNEGGGAIKSDFELLREADLLDYWAANPPKPLPPKQACEAFGDHVYVISPEGNAYCLAKYTDD